MDSKIVTVKRANVILHVNKDQLKYYMDQGYDLINDNGDVIESSIPRDLGTLQKAYVEHEAQLKKLQEDNNALIAEIVNLKKKANSKKSTKTNQ